MVVEEVFAVIAEGTRRDILTSLAKEHKAVGQLVEELGVSQPTVSKHLRVLREAGVVTMRAQGQKRFYSINTAPLALVSEWLHGLGAGVTNAVKTAAQPAPDMPALAAPAPQEAPREAARAARVTAPPEPRLVAAAAPSTLGLATKAREKVGYPTDVALTHVAEGDGSVQHQITRSVGRAATKAADLLANLPALPSFRRRKD